jgi:hypothetical protein
MCTKKRKREIKFASQKNEHDCLPEKGKNKVLHERRESRRVKSSLCFCYYKKKNRNMKEGRKKFLYGEMERRVAKRDQ